MSNQQLDYWMSYVHINHVRNVMKSTKADDLVGSLFDIHFSVVANRTNDVMKTLAVLSAIILPLSLIAGIYGMNFEYMPELKSPIGYFATLGVMALVAAVLLVYFWRRGWIFQRDEVVDPPSSTRDDESI